MHECMGWNSGHKRLGGESAVTQETNLEELKGTLWGIAGRDEKSRQARLMYSSWECGKIAVKNH